MTKNRLVRTAVVGLVALSALLPATAAGSPLAAGSARHAAVRGGSSVERVRLRTGNRFVPRTLTVSRGTRVRWVNVSGITHTTTSATGLWDQRLRPGDSFTRRFRQAGTFRYHCSIHPEMTGTIVVT